MPEPAAALPGVLWHVTVTATGSPSPAEAIHQGLQQLQLTRLLGMSARYSEDTLEMRYWDEGKDCRTVAAAAIGMWSEHRSGSGLPDWPIVGLEVLDRDTFRARWPAGPASAARLGQGIRQL